MTDSLVWSGSFQKMRFSIKGKRYYIEYPVKLELNYVFEILLLKK